MSLPSWTTFALEEHTVAMSHHSASARARHRADGMMSKPSEEPDVARLFDGGASRGDVELSVDRHRVRLHGVVREKEPRPDLPEREVRREEWEHVQLSRRQR